MIVICLALFMGTKFLPSGYKNETYYAEDKLNSKRQLHYKYNNDGKMN